MLRSGDPHSTMDSFVNPATSELSVHICLSSKSTQKSFNQSINASFLSVVWILKIPVSHWAAPGKIDLDLILDIKTLKTAASKFAAQTHKNPKKKSRIWKLSWILAIFMFWSGSELQSANLSLFVSISEILYAQLQKAVPFCSPYNETSFHCFLLFPWAEARAWIVYNSQCYANVNHILILFISSIYMFI